MAAPIAPDVMETPTVDPAADVRAKVKKFKAPGYPAPDASDGDVIAYLRGLSRESDPDANARYRQGARNLLYIYGRQYLTFSKRTRTWEDLPLLDEKDVRATDNCILPALRSRAQRLLSGPVQFDGSPRRNDLDARDRARLGAEWVQSRWKSTHMVQKVDQALMLAFACGIAVLKGFWNRDLGPLTPATMQRMKTQPVLDPLTGEPALDLFTGEPQTEPVIGEDGEPVVETYFVDDQQQEVADREQAFQFRPGDTDTAVRSIFNVRINSDATAWDVGAGLRWLLDTDTIPVETAKAMFPEFAEKIEASAPDDMLSVTLERLAASAAVAATLGAQQQTGAASKPNGQTTVIQEYWELPNTVFPKGRLIVRVGQVKVYDDVFPDGVFPYTPIFDEPAPLTPMGRPCVNDGISLQDTINRQWNAINTEAQQGGVGRWVSWEIPGVPEQLAPEDRTVIQIPMRGNVANRSLRDLFHRLDPPAVSPDRWRLLEASKRALQDVFAFHEVSRGQTPPGVDSGVAIDSLREEERGQLAKAVRALEASIIHWATVQLAIARANYGDQIERWLQSEQAELGYILQTVNGLKLPDPDELTLELQGFKPQSETAFKGEVKEALGLGLLDPREARELLDLGRGMTGAFTSQSRHYQRARWINLALERGEYAVVPGQPVLDPSDPTAAPIQVQDVVFPDGRPMVLPDDDDHAVHLMVLDELVLNEQKPWEVRQVAMLLKGQRRRVMDLAAADAAPPPAPGGPPPADGPPAPPPQG